MSPWGQMAIACGFAGAASAVAMVAVVWSFFTDSWAPVVLVIACLAVAVVALGITQRIRRQEASRYP